MFCSTRISWLVLILVVLLSGGCGLGQEEPAVVEVDPEYQAEIEEWRQNRDQRLRSENGWLTLVGLHWLEPGQQTFGSAGDNDVVFPENAPERCGTFTLEEGAVSLHAEPGAGLTSNGEAVASLRLVTDIEGSPTVVSVGTLSFHVINRQDRFGIRLKDSNSATLTGFTGIKTYPTDPSWRIVARFEAYDPPHSIGIPTVLGTVVEEQTAGAVVFERDGATHRIDAIGEVTGDLFLIFADRTNGAGTYAAGRFLYAQAPAEDGSVVLDFNQAYNPPCAFSPYATCPLPPPQNQLAIAVEAGEKLYGGGHH